MAHLNDKGLESARKRIDSLDILRGIVMILMVVDHTRYFFHETALTSNPEDLQTSSPALFLTRWITHLCAPVFIFLVGTSAFLFEQKVQSKQKLSRFLLVRGLILILLELTVLKFAWEFNKFTLANFTLLVIWAIGISMIFLAAMIYLNKKLLLVIGLLIVFEHNLLDSLHFQQGTTADAVWKLLHERGWFPIGDTGTGVYVLFSVLPYLGLVLLGYSTGQLYTKNFDPIKRKRVLLWLGIGSCLLFVLLRFPNVYGDPNPWSYQKNTVYTILSFIQTTKYPTSLQYLLMTIGPALIFLSFAEGWKNKFTTILTAIGRTPMYFYLWHLFIIHTAALITGGRNTHTLPVVYIATILITILLYFLCKWYGTYKYAHPEKKWLSYI